MINKILFTTMLSVLSAVTLFSQNTSNSDYSSIYSGVPLFDNNGNIVNAHGACIVKEKNTFYLIGECHTDTSNAFVAFNCYSSPDLYNWKFEKQVLKIQEIGMLGPNRIGERVKVMKCPATGEFVMYMHTDDIKYKDPCIAYATSTTINSDYTFRGALLFNGNPIKMWDMGTFQDYDGTGYLLIHEGNIYKLSPDYKSIEEHTAKDISPGSESPAIFKSKGTYFWLSSSKTSWERNDNFYFVASSLKGPWISKGKFAPQGKLTWNSQTTFVLPIIGNKDTTFMYMGDRWSYPRQASAATYVWQPLKVSGTTLFVPDFIESWQVNTTTGKWTSTKIKGKTIDNNSSKTAFSYKGDWYQFPKTDSLKAVCKSGSKDASVSIKFTGSRIYVYGHSAKSGGYAQVSLTDKNNRVIYNSTIDFYSKYPDTSIKYVSPKLKRSEYNLTVRVIGEGSKWSNKAGNVFGSTGNDIIISKISIDREK